MNLPQIQLHSLYPQPAQAWRDIPGYEGLYRASNFGRFEALDKTYYTGENHLSKRFKRAHALKFGRHRDGYLQIALSKNGNARTMLAHKIIADLFVENPENKPEVNHEDGNKRNICAYNLTRMTRLENMRHSYETGLNKGRKMGEHNRAKIVFDMQTGIYFDCMKEAATAKKLTYKNLQNRLLGIVKNNTGLVYA